VFEDDRGGVSGLEGDLVGALNLGDAVGDEGVAQAVGGPLDAEDLGERSGFLLHVCCGKDAAALGVGGEPCGEVVADRNKAAGGGFGLVGADRDEAALQIDRAPIDPRHLGGAQSSKGSEGNKRNHFWRSRVEQESHLRRRENAGGRFTRFDFGEGFGLGGFVFGKVAAGFYRCVVTDLSLT